MSIEVSQVLQMYNTAKNRFRIDKLDDAKSFLTECLQITKEMILEATVEDSSLYQGLKKIIAKGYLLYARIAKKSKNYSESTIWYQKAHNFIKSNCYSLHTLNKIVAEMKRTNESPLKTTQRHSPYQPRAESEKSRIKTRAKKSAWATVNEIEKKHEKSPQRIRNNKIPIQDLSFRKSLNNMNFNLHSRPGSSIKRKEPDTLNDPLKEIISDRSMKSSKFSYKPGSPVDNMPRIRERSFSNLKKPVLSIESNITVPLFNRKIVKVECKPLNNGKILVLKSSLYFENKISQVAYSFFPLEKYIEIECTYLGKSFHMNHRFEHEDVVVHDYIKKMIEPGLAIVGNHLEIVEPSKTQIIEARCYQENGTFQVIINEYRPRCCLEVIFIIDHGTSDEKTWKKSFFPSIDTDQVEFFLEKFSMANQEIVEFPVHGTLQILAFEKIVINQIDRNLKITKIGNENYYIYVDNFIPIKVNKKYLVALLGTDSTTEIISKEIINCLDIIEGKLLIVKKEKPKPVHENSETYNEGKSEISKEEKSITLESSDLSPTKLKLSKLLLIIRIQQIFRNYLKNDRKKLLAPEGTVLLRQNKYVGPHFITLVVTSKTNGCLTQIIFNEEAYSLFTPYYIFPSQRFMYIKRFISFISMQNNEFVVPFQNKIYKFNQEIFNIDGNRIIYRASKVIKLRMYQIVVSIQENKILEFIVSSSVDYTQKFRIDIQTLCMNTGIGGDNLKLLISFAINCMLVIKESNICYLDLTKKFDISFSIIRLQACIKGAIMRKKHKDNYLKLILKTYANFKGIKFCVCIFVKQRALLVRLVKGFDVIGVNLSKELLESEGFLILDLEVFVKKFLINDIQIDICEKSLKLTQFARFII